MDKDEPAEMMLRMRLASKDLGVSDSDGARGKRATAWLHDRTGGGLAVN